MLESIKKVFSLKDNNSETPDSNKTSPQSPNTNIQISDKLQDNKNNIKTIFEKCSDLAIREIKITNDPKISAMVVYLTNLSELPIIEEGIIKKLTTKNESTTYPPQSEDYCRYLLGIADDNILTDMNKTVDSILLGKVALFIDGINKSMIINVNKPPSRSIEQPDVEGSVRGPREGFTESISTNIALIRKIIKSSKLKTEPFTIGRETKTTVVMAYISTIANEDIINEVRSRISKIDIDGALNNNYLREYISDAPLNLFPTIFSSEKPDVVANKLLEGRVAIFTDGSPVANTVPSIFSEFLIAGEDYNIKFYPASINRLVRYFSFILSLILPGLFVAITSFHQEVIPTPLLISLMKARSVVPYPAFIECLLTLLIFEILREAGIRTPKAVGQSISIVGALVLGQAAVEAGFISAPMIIIMSITAICAFTIPSIDLSAAIALPRLIFLFLGAFTGLLGLICGILILFLNLISIRSFGVPYMYPMAPIVAKDVPYTFLRGPIWSKFTRSWFITGNHSIRRKVVPHVKSIEEEHQEAIDRKNKE